MRNLFWIFTLISFSALAQDSPLSLLKEPKPTTEYAEQTFKSTRLVTGQTVETKSARELEFIFAHRFGPVNSGAYELFGLDQAFVRLGLEYGITDRLGVGFGRNSVDKTMDAYLRYKLLRQSTGERNMPVTITAFGNAAIRLSPRSEDSPTPITTQDRLSYTVQALIARKFNEKLSLQLMPSWVHRNTVDQDVELNDQLAVGVGGRYKITGSVALTSEYYYRLNVPEGNPYYNSFGLGVDIETGGHVFQLIISNSQGLTERAFIAETTGQWSEGDLHLGFNVTRTFQFRKKK
ncbi:MAG: hypothetical protein JNL17_06225 [Cyclobacteriaceae bacterium]|nr:hypothetical protein [Cyclobacteriaceae bacterium]